MKVFVHQKKERSQFVIAQYSQPHFKSAKVNLLLSGKSKIYPQHQRVNLLALPLDIPRLHLLTFLSLRLLVLSQDNLALKLTGSLCWLKVYMSMFQDLQMPSTPKKIRFKCVLLLLRHNQMRFNASWRRAFSYSCQKRGEQSLCIDYIDWTIAYSKGESITRRKVCIVKGGVL